MSEQVITVDVELDMVSEHFEVDLFVDGVIRNFWQSTRNAVNKHRAPSVGFTQGIHKDTRSMYRSDMITAAIPSSRRKSDTPKTSSDQLLTPELGLITSGILRTNVGSIDIMISKQDHERNAHYHGYMIPDEVPKDWHKQALAPSSEPVEPTLQMAYDPMHCILLMSVHLTPCSFMEGSPRMQEADRGGTRTRLKRTRVGEAPWCTFKFLYRDPAQLRAGGIGGAGGRILGHLTGASRKRAAPGDDDDGSMSPSSGIDISQHNLENLRSEILELKMQTERAKRLRLEEEKKTDEIARQTQQDWAKLELAKKELVRELADERAKVAAQEAEQQNLRQGYTNAILARQRSE
ncbi:MAG: hypothetical protein Q9169_005913 [Polycauliona sp. 2 TL-2023]